MLNDIGSDLAKFRHLHILQVTARDRPPTTYDNFFNEAEILSSWSRLGAGLGLCQFPCKTPLEIEFDAILIHPHP
jgi:hypothetical protein